MTDSMGPGKLVRHMQNPSYTLLFVAFSIFYYWEFIFG